MASKDKNTNVDKGESGEDLNNDKASQGNRSGPQSFTYHRNDLSGDDSSSSSSSSSSEEHDAYCEGHKEYRSGVKKCNLYRCDIKHYYCYDCRNKEYCPVDPDCKRKKGK